MPRFERERFGRGSDRGSGRNEGRHERSRRDAPPLEMHEAVCAECGIDCEVPFRPSGTKPVLCRDCFRKGGDRPSAPSSGNRDYDLINEKLNKIMKALNIK